MRALRAELEQEKSHSADILDAANEMESRMSRLCLHIKDKDEQIMRLKALESQVSWAPSTDSKSIYVQSPCDNLFLKEK